MFPEWCFRRPNTQNKSEISSVGEHPLHHKDHFRNWKCDTYIYSAFTAGKKELETHNATRSQTVCFFSPILHLPRSSPFKHLSEMQGKWLNQLQIKEGTKPQSLLLSNALTAWHKEWKTPLLMELVPKMCLKNSCCIRIHRWNRRISTL